MKISFTRDKMPLPDPAMLPRQAGSYIIILITLACLPAADAAILYRNTFDTSDNLTDFTVYGEEFIGCDPPPLHAVSVDAGQLRIDTTQQRPNGPGTYPVLSGRAFLSLDTSRTFQQSYNPTLSQNSRLISWCFNVSNQDGALNNDFSFVLASTLANPYNTDAKYACGYALCGGGMVGNRMVLKRFDYGLGGGNAILVDITDGLGPLPEKGSFRITFDPAASMWSLYGKAGSEYTDPTQVNTLLGTAIDSTYTHEETPYAGLLSTSTGTTYFDNFTVVAVPEPASLFFILSTMLAAGFIRRRFPA
jgi:hypothetical protein